MTSMVSFPDHFLAGPVDLGDIPKLKAWGARFFVNQLSELSKLGLPTGQPNRSVLEALIDAILGEIIASRDALRRELKGQIRALDLRAWSNQILSPLTLASLQGRWLWKVESLRNQALHGTYLPKTIGVTVPDITDLRLTSYPKGIVADMPLPKDLVKVCEEMEGLIDMSRAALEAAKKAKASSPTADQSIADGFAHFP